MYHAIPHSALWVVPNGGHGSVFFDAAPQFAQTALAFFRESAGRPTGAWLAKCPAISPSRYDADLSPKVRAYTLKDSR